MIRMKLLPKWAPHFPFGAGPLTANRYDIPHAQFPSQAAPLRARFNAARRCRIFCCSSHHRPSLARAAAGRVIMAAGGGGGGGHGGGGFGGGGHGGGGGGWIFYLLYEIFIHHPLIGISLVVIVDHLLLPLATQRESSTGDFRDLVVGCSSDPQ